MQGGPRSPLLLAGNITPFHSTHTGAISYRLESITARELVLMMPDGTRETWTRAPAK
jgi:hypothetical protein